MPEASQPVGLTCPRAVRWSGRARQVSSLTVWQLSDGADIVPAGKPSLVISRQVCNCSPARCCKSQAHRWNLPRFNHAAFVPNGLQDSLYSICKRKFLSSFSLPSRSSLNIKQLILGMKVLHVRDEFVVESRETFKPIDCLLSSLSADYC